MSVRSERSLKRQGNQAEKVVSGILHSLGSEYVVFDNVMLKRGKGTTQIDHVVVSPYGIFVIETKSHKGRIFGDCAGKVWTQVCGSQKNTFYSPFLQNYAHLRGLYALFGLDCQPFCGLIVFTSDSVDLSNVQCPCVLHVSMLYNAIMGFRVVRFDAMQVQWLCDTLRSGNCQSAYFDRKHKDFVKRFKR